MKLEFLVKDKEMVKMLMLNEVEYFYNSHLFDLLKKEALMDGDNKTSNMFYKYVSNAKDIVNGRIVEKIDGSLSKIYLGLNDNSQRHEFKIEPCELSLEEKTPTLLLGAGFSFGAVNGIGEQIPLGNTLVRLNKELSSFYYFERGMFDKVDFDYIDSKFLKIRKIAMFNYSDLTELLEEERLERRLTADKEILRKVMKR